MGDDPTIDVPPARRRRLTIRSMMLAVIFAGVLLGWALGLERARRRVGQATSQLYALMAQLERDDPSVPMIETKGEGRFTPLEAGSTVVGRLETATGARIAITITVRSRVFRGETGLVVLESGGRSVTWPLEDLRRGRKFDLRAIFPEAF